MKTNLRLAALAVLLSTLNSQLTSVQAQGTAFTYQGRLTENGAPASGVHDFTFTLYDAASGGAPVGGSNVVNELAVTNGLFTVALDFGAAFDGSARWLQIAVRPGASTGDYANLVPRQAITATPYAVTAGNLSGALPSGQFSGYYSSAVTLANAANQITGTFIGDGNALGNVSVGALRLGSVLDVGVARFESVFAPSPEYVNSTHQLAAGDFNGDGWPDIAILDYPNGTATALSVYTNNTQKGFSRMWQVVTNQGGFRPVAIAAGDFNGDGRADLFRANSGINSAAGDSVSLYLGGAGTMTAAGQVTTGGRPAALLVADFNQDGRPDLVTGNTVAGTFQVFVNTGAALPSLAGNYPFPATGDVPETLYLAAGDLNGDGRLDLIAGLPGYNLYSSARLCLLTNSGGATLASAVNYSPSSLGEFYMSFTGLRCADVDGDGVPEISYITYDPAGNAGRILKRPAFIANGDYSIWKRLPGTASLSLVVADFNFDGRPELVSGPQFFGNNGVGNFGLDAVLPAFTYNSDLGVEADFDRDGRLDLFMAGGNSKRLLLNRAGVTTRGSFEVKNSAGGSRFVVDDQGLRLLATNGNVLFAVSQTNGAISGNGSGLTQLNASQLTTGTVPDSRLPASVALRTSPNNFTGNQTIAAGSLGVGIANPQTPLHVYSASSPASVRIQSSAAPGFGRVEFVSDPQGGASEWRPGYIQSTDNGGFTGGLSFVVNGTGFDNRFAEVETMRVVNGRVGIGTATPVSALQVAGTVTATAFNPPSDRALKENFASVSPREVLEKVAALPISRWNFIGDSATRHVGPMAQDFHAAFNLGTDDKHIATVDADGVALAAIQGLNEKVEVRTQRSEISIQKLEAEVKAKDARIAELEHRLSAIEARLQKQPTNKHPISTP